jgi:DNA repair protein RecO (recombination protein O)
LDLITKCETIDFFLPVRKDIERLTYANYFIELVDVVTNDYDINSDLYTTLTESLRLLATDASAKRVSRVFELKLLKDIGLNPELGVCSECGKDPGEKPAFSVSLGGVICSECSKGKGTLLHISQGTLNFMRKVQSSSFDRIQQVKVSREVGAETEKVLKRFMEFHINRRLKSLNFLKDLKKVGAI